MWGRGVWSFVLPSSSVAAVLFLSFIVLTVCPVSDDSSADPQPLPYSDVTWDLDKTTGTLTISGHGAMPDFNNYDNIAPWRTDENRPFVQRVVIGDEVTSIGAYSFYECNFMDSLTVGDSVYSIGDYSFFNCNQLSDPDLGDSVTTIGAHAFGGCIGIRTLIIPDSVTTIGHNAFNGCSELTDLSFPSALLTVGEDAFSPWSFVENVGPILVNADNLKGKEFTLVTGEFHIRDDVRVIFDTEGGSSIDSVLVVYNTPANRPADPTKTAYGFVDWYSDKYLTSLYDFYGNVTTRTTLYAKWNPLPYSITYHTYDEYTDTTANPAVYTIETPSFVLNPVSRDNYVFLGWFDAETGGSQVTGIDTGTYGNLVLYAHWSPTHKAVFMSQGELYQSFDLVASSSIAQPTPDPVKASDSMYDYTFSHWDGYTPGMTMGDSDVTFNAVFIKSGRIVMESGKVKVNVDENRVLLTKEKIDMVVSMADSDRNLTMTVDLDNCKVSFDNAALRSLKSSNTELCVQKKTDAEKTADEKRIAGDGPVYEMTFGDNTDFRGGMVTFTIPYKIPDGKSADDLYIAYISDVEVKEEIECDYEGGSVSFSTGHLSVYTMLYREVKDTNFLQDFSLGGFLIFGLIFAIAASALILAILKKTK